MWDFKYRPIKKVVEARTRYGGVDVLLTTHNRLNTKLSMNGAMLIRHSEMDEFVQGLADAVKKSREILESQ